MAQGAPRDPYQQFRFVIDVDGCGSARFETGSELACEIGEAVYWEGGSLIPVKLPGRLTFPDIELARGASEDFDLYNWAVATANAASGRSSKDERNLTYEQRDIPGDPAEYFAVYGAQMRRWATGGWDNKTDDVRVEQAKMSYSYFEREAA